MLHLSDTNAIYPSRKGAAFVAKTSPDTVRSIALEIISTNPRMSADQLLNKFWQRVQENGDYMLALAGYFFTNQHTDYHRRARSAEPVAMGVYLEKKAQTERVVSKAVETVKLSILNLIMPNGKPARDCTGTEMGRFGAGYSLIAKKVGARIVGKVLSESEIRKLM